MRAQLRRKDLIYLQSLKHQCISMLASVAASVPFDEAGPRQLRALVLPRIRQHMIVLRSLLISGL